MLLNTDKVGMLARCLRNVTNSINFLEHDISQAQQKFENIASQYSIAKRDLEDFEQNKADLLANRELLIEKLKQIHPTGPWT